MGIGLEILKKQGSQTSDGHAEVRVTMKVDGKVTADAIYVAVIKDVAGKPVVEIETRKMV